MEFLIAAGVALPMEAALVFLSATGVLAIWAALAIHAVIVAGLVVWVRTFRRRRFVHRTALLLVTATAVLGPLGAAGGLLTALLHRRFRRTAKPFQAWYLSIFGKDERAPAQELYDLILSGRERGGEPQGRSLDSFSDVMRFGTPHQKQAIIALLARHFRPIFAPILRLALDDTDASVRVQAATAKARIEDDFLARWVELEHVARAAPRQVAAQRNLAGHLDDYAFTGLLDEDREREIRAGALAAYRRCVEMAPDEPDARLRMGRLLLRLEDPAAATACLESLALEPGASPELLGWYAEGLFRLRRYEACRRIVVDRLAPHLPEPTLPEKLRHAILLWSVPETTG